MSRIRVMLHPLHDRIVVIPTEDSNDGTEELFSLAADSAKEKPQQALVVAVGPGRRNQFTGEMIPMSVEVGQTILHARYAGTEVTIQGTAFTMIRDEEVLGILKREEVEGEEPEELKVRPPARAEAAEDAPELQELLCHDESHEGNPPPATHVADGPHGKIAYCESHALAYQKVMGDLGTPVEVVPISSLTG